MLEQSVYVVKPTHQTANEHLSCYVENIYNYVFDIRRNTSEKLTINVFFLNISDKK